MARYVRIPAGLEVLDRAARRDEIDAGLNVILQRDAELLQRLADA